MPLFSRSLKADGDDGVPAEDRAAEAAARHTIGELLRETRQSYGGDIDRIAATLRIRAAYLTAIEENQYAKLPGPVYAQGFVRAYAVHLGLDGDEAIRRFKQEVDGFEVTRDLSFPVPLAERSIPGGTMLLAALILAVCGYGLWYYVSTGDRTHPERVSAVPADIVAASQPPAPAVPASATSAPLPESSGATAPPAATASAAPPPAATPSPSLSSAPSSSASPAPVAVATATPAPVVAAPAAISAPPMPPALPSPPVVAPSAAAAPATPSPVAANTAVAAPPPVATPAPQVATAPATEPPPDSAVTPAPPAPRVFGAPANVPARIIVHAIKESWVQVRDGDNILTQRTLHPGDTVRVPDEPDLTLRTGNGAGIEFEVDGKLGKPLSGTVRTVELDADRLASGRPIVNQPTPNQAAHQADQDRAADQDQGQAQ